MRRLHLSIHTGEGGADAAIFVQNLTKIYLASLPTPPMNIEISKQSTTMQIVDQSFARWKWEKGVHRCVRVSPTDTKKRVHTSAAMVHV